MNCRACGQLIPERAKFCPECGTAATPQCAQCGVELPPAAKFCAECGTPVAVAAAADTAVEAWRSTAMRRGKVPDSSPGRLLILAALAFGAICHSPARSGDVPANLEGVWTATDSPSFLVRFSPEGFAVFKNARVMPMAPIIRYESNRLYACFQGRTLPIDFEISAARTLVLHGSADPNFLVFQDLEGHSLFTRAPEGSSSLFDPPAQSFDREATTSTDGPSLRQELARRREIDQNQQSTDGAALLAAQEDNSQWVRDLLTGQGCLSANDVGADGLSTIFLLVQHSGDLGLMKGFLACLDAVGDRRHFALVYDRVQLWIGKKQLYGTQLWSTPSGLGLAPLAHPEQLNELRSTMGLPPIEDYLKRFGVTEFREHRCEDERGISTN